MNALYIAKWFIFNNKQADTNTYDGRLVIQKLCYFAQAMYLSVYGKPLFLESIQAWKNGPVIKSVWEKCVKENTLNNMQKSDKKILAEINKSDGIELLLKVVNSVYGYKTPNELRLMSHEKPWLDLREQVEKHINPIIDNDAIKDYYASLKPVYEANAENDFDNETFISVNGNNFSYNTEETSITDEDLEQLDEVVESYMGHSFSVYKENGELVVYQ